MYAVAPSLLLLLSSCVGGHTNVSEDGRAARSARLNEPTQYKSWNLPWSYADINEIDEELTQCKRPCIEGAPPRVCKYHFVLERYSTMGPACLDCPNNRRACFKDKCVTADGIERGIMTVNRIMPGPAIEVCKGDTVVVDIDNRMQGSTTTIHWHGVLQRGSPYFDGVPMITQCPIPEATTFRYIFVTDEVGTYFWHSHDGLQKMDGITGALIVRSSNDPSLHHYDMDLSEHVMILHDWLHHVTTETFPGPRVFRRGQLPDAVLINGRGRFRDPATGRSNGMPLAEFRVKAGLRYRFRIIHAGCLVCPLQITIQDHSFLVIATDAFAVRPIYVDSLVILPGERYDIVVSANRPAAAYWIHVKAIGECDGISVYQEAVLRYEGVDDNFFASSSPGHVGFPTGLVMNPLNAACGPGLQGVCVSQLQAQVAPSKPDTLLTTPNIHRIIMDFDFHHFSYKQLFRNKQYYKFFIPAPADIWMAGRMNNISFVVPSSPPLSQPEAWKDMCARGNPRCCSNPPQDYSHRECFNVHSVPLGANIEMIFVDNLDTNGTVTHPVHLHGYMFYVMEMGTRQERHLGGLTRATSGRGGPFFDNPNPVKKDTIAVPSGGYTRVRFVAKNPGYWLIHCHILVHSESGMAAVLRVGEQSDLPPVPPEFPKCGNFEPSYH